MGLYEWTNDKPFPTQSEIRKKYIDNISKKASDMLNEKDSLMNFAMKRNQSTKVERKSKSSNNLNEFNSLHKKDELFGEESDLIIQDKYMNEVRNKYKMSIPEMNEKIIVVNEDTRKLISDVIMENTVYNI